MPISVLTGRPHSGRRVGFLAVSMVLSLSGGCDSIVDADAVFGCGKFTLRQFILKKPQMPAMYLGMRNSNVVLRALGQIGRQLRQPAFALFCALVLGCAAIPIGWNAFDRAQQFAADDPVMIADRALDDVLNRSVAEREIHAALAAGDLDLAQSFLDLSADRGVTVDPQLADQVRKAQTDAATTTHTVG